MSHQYYRERHDDLHRSFFPRNGRPAAPSTSSLALWVIAGSLVFVALVLLFIVLACAGLFVLWGAEQEETIRREPWRKFERNNGF